MREDVSYGMNPCFASHLVPGTELQTAHCTLDIGLSNAEDGLCHELSQGLTNSNRTDAWVFVKGNEAARN